MTTNPFTYGNPISAPARFFGRKAEVEQVYTRLLNAEFESSSIVGERRAGKTSLLNYIAHPSTAQAHGLAPDRYIFVYVDLQMVDQKTTPSRFWSRLLHRVARELKDEELQAEFEEAIGQEVIDNYTLDDLFSFTDERDLGFILLLDEFENVTENANFDTDFFYGLRALAIHHNLALITASRQELITLCHSDAVRASPFFNIFANVNLPAFNEEDARAFIEQSLAETGVQFVSAELALMSDIAGFHPYFLQIAAHFLFAAHCQGIAAQEREQYLLREFEEEATPSLADYWHHSNDGEKIVLSALALLAKQGKAGKRRFSLGKLKELYQRSDLTLSRLEKRALIAAGEEGYTLFSSVFGDWIVAELTDVMADAQSYEEWLEANQSALQRFSRSTRDEIGEILPQIKAGYRQFIVDWLSDPQTLVSAATLLRGVFG
ncbi:MAG: AAA-like domain-containing protein [Anaerolineae bacterium]|nr:AAA-like domain-containing protein [Anaerolineae bacterium]